MLIVGGALGAALVPSEAKIPGAVHCFNDICHRVRTIAETEQRVGHIEAIVASYYDDPDRDRFNPRSETSSGEQFIAEADDNAASPLHPDGTVLLLWSPTTRAAAVVRINNAGPYFPGRVLDVSRGVADRLGFGDSGVMTLMSVVIAAPQLRDATYVRARVYPKVPGYFGMFASLDLARQGAHGFVPQIDSANLQVFAALPLVAEVTTGSVVRSAASQSIARPATHSPRIETIERKTRALPTLDRHNTWQMSVFAGSGR